MDKSVSADNEKWDNSNLQDLFEFFKSSFFEENDKETIKVFKSRETKETFFVGFEDESEPKIKRYYFLSKGKDFSPSRESHYKGSKRIFVINLRNKEIKEYKRVYDSSPKTYSLSFWEKKHPYSAFVWLMSICPSLSSSTFTKIQARNKRELSNLIKNRDKICLVLGAGVSVSCGFPTWDKTLKNLKKIMENRSKATFSISFFEKIGNSAITKTQFFKDVFPIDYPKAVQEALYQKMDHFEIKDGTTISETANLIRQRSQRGNPIPVFTYNFDDSLERAIGGLDYQRLILTNTPKDKEFGFTGVLHLNGYIPNPKSGEAVNDSFVFSEDSYNSIMGNRKAWQNQIQRELYSNHRCLFIGCSLSDPMQRFFLQNSNHGKKYHDCHFALMSSDRRKINSRQKGWIQRAYSRLGVQCIWFKNYKSLADFIKQMTGKI
jgi:hypothetical protein